MPLTPELVYQVIQGVTKVDSNEREHSEGLLKKWQKDATPGMLDSLMQIAAQVANISEVILLCYLCLCSHLTSDTPLLSPIK